MKNWLMVLALLYVLQGCSKEVNPPAEKRAAVLETLAAMDIPAQRVSFSLMPARDRFQVWQDHLQLKLAQADVSSLKWKLISELIQYNSEAFYEDGKNDKKEIAVTLFAVKWLTRAESVFSRQEIYELAFSINPVSREESYLAANFAGTATSVTRLDQNVSPYNDEKYPDCVCAVGSNYTCPYTTYYHTTYGDQMVLNYGSCSYNGSRPCDTEGGCGFLGWQLCDGNTCSNY